MSTKKVSIVEVTIWMVLIFIVMLALSPYLVGFKVKSDYANLIDSMSKVSQQDLHIKEYSQGFYSSDVILELNLSDANESVTFKEEIIHGPVYLGLINQNKSPLIAAVVNGELQTKSISIENLNNILSNTGPIMYQHLIDFKGDVESQVYIPAISSTYEEETGPVTVQSSGAIFKQTLTTSTGELKGDIKIPMLKVTDALFDFSIEHFALSFSGKEGINQLIVGDTVASIETLDINSAGEQFSVRDLTARSVTSDVGGLINSGTQLSVREVLASNHMFGPFKLNLSINGLNANSLSQLQLTQQNADDKLRQGDSPEQVNAMMMTEVITVLPDLIKQAEITINPLSINSELGRLEADMEFRLEGIDVDAPLDPISLLNAIKLELNMTIDEQLLKQMVAWNLENIESNAVAERNLATPNVLTENELATKINDNIKAMLDVSWIVKSEGVYLTKISMQNGGLLINEKPLDPMQHILSSVGSDSAAAAQ